MTSTSPKCDHVMHSKHDEIPCQNRAKWHYRAEPSGIIVRLCGVHANCEQHRWKAMVQVTEPV